MTPPETAPAIVELDHVEMRCDPAPYEFSAGERAAIDAFYAERRRSNPALWNGRILILAASRLEGRTLVGRYAQADYAALLWMLGAPTPHPSLRNCFAMGALRGSDGGFVMVRMAEWTANAGRVYFAAGTPDLSDVTADGRVDLEGSLLREFEEETGISAADVVLASGWTALHDARRVALLRQLVARADAATVAQRIQAFAAGQERPEVDEAYVVRQPGDIPEGTPPFLHAYLAAVWEADKMKE